MIDLTVLIPTHNPRRPVLARVMAALAAQSFPRERWEVVLIDNGSTPALQASEWATLGLLVAVIREDQLGLSFARLAGIRAACGKTVVFVDDDNVLGPTYLETAATFLSKHPRVGVLGGRLTGEFAVPPAAWAQPHLGSLALRDLGSTVLISSHHGVVDEYDSFAPFGAGMVVRRDICRAFADATASGTLVSIDRCGNKLGGCGDCELVMLAWRAGYECAYVPQLEIRHLIPASRLTFGYLQRLAREGQESWSDFLCRHQLKPRIARWTVPIRQARAFVRNRAWTRSGFIRWRAACGYFAGAAKPRCD